MQVCSLTLFLPHIYLCATTVGSYLAGPCIEVSGTFDGAIARMRANCTVDPGPGTYSAWTLGSGSAATSQGPATQIRVFGKCLDVRDGVDADGTGLQLWECTTNNPNQLFVVNDADGSIRWYNRNKCVDVPNGQLGPVSYKLCAELNYTVAPYIMLTSN
jgi:hypothetical protein